MSEDEAIAALRARQPRHRDPVPDRSLMRMAAVVLVVVFLGWLAVGLLF